MEGPIKSAGSKKSIELTLPKEGFDLQITPRDGYQSQTDATPRDSILRSPQKLPPRGMSQTSVSFRDGRSLLDPAAVVAAVNIPPLTEHELKRRKAVRVLEAAWVSFRNKQMFLLLKNSICAAETSLTYEILRKISPKEAEFLRDKGAPIKVRFRFGGSEFPPMIYFKVFSDNQVTKIKYMSGKKAIRGSSQAARDACDRMGNRRYFEIMLQDTMHQERYKVTDEVDVTTLKDYMQYLSRLDEMPANMGGKDNMWRKLTLHVLPRTTIFYDIVDFLYSQRLSERLKAEIPNLSQRPQTQQDQLEHIRIIGETRTPPPPNQTPRTHYSAHDQRIKTPESSRRSRKALHKMEKMRQMYGLNTRAAEVADGSIQYINESRDIGELPEDTDIAGEEWEEEEAASLYQWTQELSFEDLDTTPRVTSIVQ